MMALAKAIILLHFAHRRILQCMFMGTPGTWHSGTNISLL